MDTKNYTSPELLVEYIEVEQGFGLSNYGDYGEPGQDSGYNDSDWDL
mgnify:FL=1